MFLMLQKNLTVIVRPGLTKVFVGRLWQNSRKLRGRKYVFRRFTFRSPGNSEVPGGIPALVKREAEMLRLVANGKAVEEIAKILDIPKGQRKPQVCRS